jgi:tRNA A-37 threonylcarbamoyl transferase component Bud32
MDGLRELDRIGSQIAGKYRLEMILGRGGMGTVYRATHTWTGRPVAVKLLHHEHAHDAASVSRFLREARAAAAVRHPNAVDVLDMGQDETGAAYLVLEYLEGDTLAAHLAQGRMAVDEVVRCFVPILEALEELHKAGVVHRDLKPANVFLARAVRGGIIPKLLDFGVAKVLEANSSLVTTTGIVVGTPAYMAPEQAAGNGNVGPWTDIWAAGTVLYECLTGELPFSAPTPSLMLVDVMTKTAPRLSTKRPDLSPALCAVVDRALAKEPADRFSSCTAMADALCEAAGMVPPSPIVSAPVRGPVAFAETQAMRTPVPPHAATAPATDVPARSEPPATGPRATAGRMRSPRLRRTGLVVAALVATVAALAGLRVVLSSREHAAVQPPPPPVVTAVTAPAPVAAPPANPIPTLAPLPAALPPKAEVAAAAPPPASDERPAPRRRARKVRTEQAALVPASGGVTRTLAPAVAPPAPPADEPRGPAVEREW